jgi:hypothetical protein
MAKTEPTFRVCGRVWLLSILPDDHGAPETVARECMETQDIAMRPRRQIEDARSTLLHELIHAVDDTLAIHLEEQQTELLEAGLYALMADNGADWSWLDSRIKAAGVLA